MRIGNTIGNGAKSDREGSSDQVVLLEDPSDEGEPGEKDGAGPSSTRKGLRAGILGVLEEVSVAGGRREIEEAKLGGTGWG